MNKNIKRFLKFDWMSKKFFIRCFLATALIAEWAGLLNMISKGKVNVSLIVSIIGTISFLLTAYTVRIVKGE